jgi:Cof subfamily protein (haloacid dehalogenase superfamily)
LKQIKLIAIDLDDTLLRDDLSISAHNQDVLKQVRDMGVAVTIATGRMFSSASPYAELLGFDLPLITYQGALVKNALSEDTIYECPLDAEVARQVILFARRKQVHVNLYLDDNLYVERVTPKGEHYAPLAGVPFHRVEDLESLLGCGNPLKMLMIEDEPVIDRFMVEFGRILEMKGLQAHLTKSKPIYLEVSNPAATKGRALSELTRWLQLDRSEVMAIGDSYNDLEMMAYAGFGVAVANACPEMRSCARYVTSSNNDDGVARALEKYVLR